MNDQTIETKFKTVYLQYQVDYPSNQKDNPIESKRVIAGNMPDDLMKTVSEMVQAGVPDTQLIETLKQARKDKSESATVHHVIYTSAVSTPFDTIEQAPLQCRFTAIAEYTDHVTTDNVITWVCAFTEQAIVTLKQMSR